MTYLSESDTETDSENEREVPNDEDVYMSNVIDHPDDEDYFCDRRVAECQQYVADLTEVESNPPLDSDELPGDIYVPTSFLDKYITPVGTTGDDVLPPFAVMDFEGIEVAKKATCLEGTLVMCTFNKDTKMYERLDDVLHFHFKTPGPVLVEPIARSPAPPEISDLTQQEYEKKNQEYDSVRKTLIFNVSRVHGLPMSLDGKSVKGSTNDYAKVWSDITNFMNKHNCSITVTKGETFDNRMLAWVLHRARETDPSLPTQIPFVTAGGYDKMKHFYDTFLPSVAGRPPPTKQHGAPLLPVSDRVVVVDKAVPEGLEECWESFCKSRTVYADMNDKGEFKRTIPHKYITKDLAVMVARIHEVICWYDHACEYHTASEGTFLKHFNSDSRDLADDPPHIHCSQRDAVAFASSVCCIINACQSHPAAQ